MVALFCGVTNCPLASSFMAFELFGLQSTPYFLIALAVSFAASGYCGLYKDQILVYSKYTPHFENHPVD